MSRRVAWVGVWFGVFALAAAAALAPIPAALVERWYSRTFFPPFQRAVTGATNLVPFALFDVLWIGAIAATAVMVRRRVREHGWKLGLLRAAGALARGAAAVYLVFLATWGLNYRRVSMFEKVAFDQSRITSASDTALGDWAARELNATYAAAHARAVSLEPLRAAFEGTLRALGGSPITPGRPKPTLLGWYFHETSIAGMTNPFLLETLVAPDLLDVERPFVVAHEWAHLAGYADEAEANFVAYLACRRGDSASRYSAALAIIGYARPSGDIRQSLALGPRIDIFAINQRYAKTSGALRFAAKEGYDKYLKANRVERGIESYDAVVQLILGTAYDEQGNPILK
ncbi:MAG TPA: DUF3810 family protein [Vicinamibacterales bacterium]